MVRAPPPAFVLITAISIFVFYVMYTQQNYADHPSQRVRVQPSSTNPKYSAPLPQASTLKDTPSISSVSAPASSPVTLPHESGSAIMGTLGNETLKAELGRAAWKLFHTTMARFPDRPTKDESDALRSYIFLFARLYPCGECATHFQQILAKYPPQTSSRNSAAAWACFVHNVVNESKGKPIFDCSNIGDFYDCGCGDEEKEALAVAGANSDKIAKGEKIPGYEGVEIEREGEINGG